MAKKGPSASKARKILRHGSLHGKPLTKKQKGLFGRIVGGSRRRR